MSVQVHPESIQEASKGPARGIKRNKNKKAKVEQGEQGQGGAGVRVAVKEVYQNKAEMVPPVNVSGDAQAMDRDPDWKRKRVPAEKRAGKQVPMDPYNPIFIARLRDKPEGFCLMYDRVQAMDIGDTLREREGARYGDDVQKGVHVRV